MNVSQFRTKMASLVGAILLTVTLSALAGHGKHATATQTLTVAAGAKITLEGNKSATLADIKAGDHVSIAYTQSNGALTAIHIRDAGPNPARHPKTTKPTTKPKHPVAPGLHAHGIVESVDASTRTLTITEKNRR